MKCKHVQQRLLATSGRRKLSAEVLAHLDGCPHCRLWQSQLALIDRSIRSLPVPDSSETKAALIAQLLEPATPATSWPARLRSITWERALIGLAASVLVLAAAYSLLRTNSSSVQPASVGDPLLARVLEKNMRLASDSSPKKRVETLRDLAEDLDDETRNLARVARQEDLTALADLYHQIVHQGLLQQAGNMTADEKEKLLPEMANKFFAASSRADTLAKEVPPSAAEPLRKIATAARDASDALRKTVAAAAGERDAKFAHEGPAPRPGGQS